MYCVQINIPRLELRKFDNALFSLLFVKFSLIVVAFTIALSAAIANVKPSIGSICTERINQYSCEY